MKINLLLILGGVLLHYSLIVDAVCRNNNQVKSKSTRAKTTLHNIIEFRKRDEIRAKDCEKKIHNKKSNSTKLPTTLGLHGLLHVRSQKAKQQTGTRRENGPDIHEAIVIKRPHEENGIKRSDKEEKQIRKIKLRTETITMLHKIVEKYFPGGQLTVEQKIKALKILGKIIKLKKEGKTSDIKTILQSLSKKETLHNKTSETLHNETSQTIILKDKKVTDSGKKKPLANKVDDDDEESGGGDIYATIANGPDVPKLPPGVNAGPEHAHSNMMPVGIQPRRGDGGVMNSMGHQNDMSDDLATYRSQYSNDQDAGTSQFGQGQIYNTGNSYYNNKVGLGGMPMMDVSADSRSRMPFSQRYLNRGSYDEQERGYDDDEDDDDDDNDGDDDDDETDNEEEVGRTRSYVHRLDFDDDDEDDDDNDSDDDSDDLDEYRNRFERKDKIAKHLRKSNITTSLKRTSANRKML